MRRRHNLQKIFAGCGVLVLLGLGPAHAGAPPIPPQINTKTIEYTFDHVTMKGFLAWDDAMKGQRPGVLVLHEFWGLNDYARRRAEQLAGLGYVALAADMYGDGKVGSHPEEARAMMETVRQNITTWRGRANAALQALRQVPEVDPSRVAAIGYCFGGATALQMAYSGADLRAVVSFHGALPVAESTEKIRKTTKILILHGADDPRVTSEAVQKFKAALDQGHVDYRFIAYPGAVHSFTVREAGNDPSKGGAYNAEADRKSWDEMKRLFQETLGR
jgi:dienelactone hydrolase